MAKLTEVQQQQTKRVLIFGPPKTGKSSLAGELSEHGWFLDWIDMEQGSSVLFKRSREAQERINLITLADTRAYPIAIETCLKITKGTKVEICQAHGKVSCPLCKKDNKPVDILEMNSQPANRIVVYDSLTQLTASAIAKIAAPLGEDFKFGYDEWAKLGFLIDTFLSSIQQAGYHVICISHEIEAESETGKNIIVPVAGTRNFSRNCAKYFDEVIYTEVKNKKHSFSSMTTANMNIMTGSRSDFDISKADNASLIGLFGTPPIVQLPVNTPVETVIEIPKQALAITGTKPVLTSKPIPGANK
jgi:hypothetical protein